MPRLSKESRAHIAAIARASDPQRWVPKPYPKPTEQKTPEPTTPSANEPETKKDQK